MIPDKARYSKTQYYNSLCFEKVQINLKKVQLFFIQQI